MIELKGFYNEDTLQKLLYKGNITQLEYIYHHSQEKIDAYKAYCQKRNLQEDEASAVAFSDYLLKSEEAAHTELLD